MTFMKRFIFLVMLWWVSVASSTQAIGIIRDAEIEDTLNSWAYPLAAAGGLDFGTVQMVVLNDSSINAFVTEGQRMFLHSGLLMNTRNADEVKGVLAHEIGHITGGHLLRLQDAAFDTSIFNLMTMLLSAAAMAGGQFDVGLAGVIAMPNVGNRLLLEEFRHNETLADQAAVSYLQNSGQSVGGLYSFLSMLAEKEQGLDIDPYQLTHPLSGERIRLMAEHLHHEPHDCCHHPHDEMRHERMVAKLKGFLLPPNEVLDFYATHPNSFGSHYAKAIVHHRAGDVNTALAIIDGLLQGRENDPYLHELRGQILFEHGQPHAAVISYARAVELSDNHPLILMGWAQAALAMNDESLLPLVLQALELVLVEESDNIMAWHFYSTAAGRNGNMGLAELALAERSLLMGDGEGAQRHTQRANTWLAKDSPHQQRLRDIQLILSDS